MANEGSEAARELLPSWSARRASPDARSVLPAGTRVAGRYRVQGVLGKGGMGIVYRVQDEVEGVHLALKCLTLPAHRDAAHAALLFRREFHTLASLRHPRIVQAFNFGVDSVGAYYTMELLDGRDLRSLAPVAYREACALLRDVASALALLHARRLLHRDISPRNVRCTSDGQGKLIDFGAIASAGHFGDIVGTAPVIPPEALEFTPLDHRADLYGLGALGYWLMTGRHAFPARSIDELPNHWRTPPPALSTLVETIPPELDELILSLLHRETAARPASAAEIIERLGAIGGIATAPELETARGYLASGALVGRTEEMAMLRAAIEHVTEASGRSLFIEAPSGMGKTRLLREVALESQLASLLVLRADGEAAGPWGVLRALTAQLLGAAPELTVHAARKHLHVIGRALPELLERSGTVELMPVSGDPREERALIQWHLLEWLVSLSARRPLAILVDDLQRCDEASASLLAALIHEARHLKALIVAAVRTDEAPRAPVALASARDGALRISLSGLERNHVETLVRSLFGDAHNVSRLAAWMHVRAGGSPLLCSELARHLVEQGVIRYWEGLWVIPETIEGGAFPHSLSEAMDARVRALSAPARSLGQVLAVFGRPTSLAMAIELAGSGREDAVFAALDELVSQEILLAANEVYRVRHDGVQEALLRSLELAERRALHRRVGDTLARETSADADTEAEIGWHLLRGGEVERGAELLEKAGRRLYRAQSLYDAVEPLRAALEAYEQKGRAPESLVELRFMLVCAGFLCDRALSLRYAEQTLRELRCYAGIDVAERLGPHLGKHAAFGAGLLAKTMSWGATVRSRRRPDPISALRMYGIASLFTAAVALASFDLPLLNELVRQMEPLRGLEVAGALRGIYLQVVSLRDVWLARFEAASESSKEANRIIERDRFLPEETRKLSKGGALFVIALADLLDRASPRALIEIEALERLGVKIWEIGAVQLRMVYHALRGEEAQAQELRARAEGLLLQAGPSWQMEVWVPPTLAYAYSLSRDVIGMKSALEAMARLDATGLPFARELDWVRAEYHRERGELELALEANTRALSAAQEVDMVFGPNMACRAEILLAMGDLAGARTVALECLAVLRQPGRRRAALIGRCERALALAEAQQGSALQAARRLELAIAESAPTQNPVIIGTLHEAAARVALLAHDAAAFERHCHEAEVWYRATRNPLLIARLLRLVGSELRGNQGSEESLERELIREAVTQIDTQFNRENVKQLLMQCRGRSERATRALELLLQATAAESGYLYLAECGKLTRVAPAHGDDPPSEVLEAFDASEIDMTQTIDAEACDARHSRSATALNSYRCLRLTIQRDNDEIIVGAFVMRAGVVSVQTPHVELLNAIAETLQVGDAPA